MALAEPIKKGGPYTKKEQEERRLEVYRLHFEYGYSAREISDMIKINRNTANSDVNFWYSEMRADFNDDTYDDLLNKQFSRLESQRVSLRKELDSDITLQERLQVKRMIIDLDSKLLSLIVKVDTTQQSIWDLAVKYINYWMEENKYEKRVMSYGTFLKIPEKKQMAIIQILEKNNFSQD